MYKSTCPILPVIPQHRLSLLLLGYYPSGSYHRRRPPSLIQAWLMCYFLPWASPPVPINVHLLRTTYILDPALSDWFCPLHINTSPFSKNFFTFLKGEKFPCEVIHISSTSHTRSCVRTLPHVASLIEGARLRRDTYQKVTTSSIHVRLDKMAPCIAFRDLWRFDMFPRFTPSIFGTV